MPEKGSEAERIEEDRLPSTLERSDQKAKDTYAETLASAEESYGDGARAHQTAWSAVKHTHEKVGDHWEPKDVERTRRTTRPLVAWAPTARPRAGWTRTRRRSTSTSSPSGPTSPDARR